MCGRIVALGKGVETDSRGQPLAEGDRIVYNYFFPCGRCVACLRDMPECCPDKRRPLNGTVANFPHFVAGFADYYYLMPGHVCVKVPAELSDALVAPINCALCQVVQGLASSHFRQGDTLVVQGAGGLGLNTIAAARDMGASKVIAVDGIPGRLELARQFGADHVIDVRELRTAADRVAAVKELTNGYVAMMQYDPRLLPRALDFMRRTRSRLPWDKIISHTFPLEEINLAFEQAEWAGRDPDQAVITRAAVTP